MGSEESLRGVAKTALGAAVVRAGETSRQDRLFADPYAQRFLDAAPGAFAEEAASAEDRAAPGPMASLGEVFYFHAVIRTRFYDDYLQAAASWSRQAVLLAAGLDTRVLRLPWPAGMRVFELDLPEVFGFKEAVLAGWGTTAACERIIVPADLRGHWTEDLLAAGLDRAAPTAWLAEGLLIYLTADEAARLLTGIGQLSAPGSRLAFEHGEMAGSALLDQARGLPEMAEYTSLWKGGLGQDAPGWLSRHGWRPTLHDLAEVAACHGRPVPAASGGGFVTAVRTRLKDPWRY